MKWLKVRLLQDCDRKINDSVYHKGQELLVSEDEYFRDSYAYYSQIKRQEGVLNVLDWIPKGICKII